MDNRIFNHYFNDLVKLSGLHGQVRYICIEYVCSFPSLDPVTMAKELIKNGIKIIFDDSSISRKENDKKRRLVFT